jgi:translation initiation factor 2A
LGLTSFHRWYRALQYTEDETKALRVVTNEVHVYNPADFAAGIVDKLRLEGVTSCSVATGQNPSVALFVAEKKVHVLSWGGEDGGRESLL